MVSPWSTDVVMILIAFSKLRLRGWCVMRAGVHEFVDTDDDRATQRACAIAKEHRVRCLRDRDGDIEQVICV
jgi:hypothetical protein